MICDTYLYIMACVCVHICTHTHKHMRERETLFLSFSQQSTHSTHTTLWLEVTFWPRSNLGSGTAALWTYHEVLSWAPALTGVPSTFSNSYHPHFSVPEFRMTRLCIFSTQDKLRAPPEWTRLRPVECAHLRLSSLSQIWDHGELHRQLLGQCFSTSALWTSGAG